MSFTDWDGMSKTFQWIGFKNYLRVFTDGDFVQVFLNNMAYVIIMLIQAVVAFFLAIVLDGNIRGRNFFKSSIFMPYILNGVAVAFIFNYLYNFENGPINLFLHSIGLGQYAIHFLSAGYSSNFSLALIGMWRFTGLNLVIFLAGLQSIPRELYEAASVDGAGFLHKVRYITIPNLMTTVELTLILGINGALQAFYEPFVITKGGPNGMTDTFITRTWQIAFNFHNFGKAAALAVVLVLFILLMIRFQRKMIKSEL